MTNEDFHKPIIPVIFVSGGPMEVGKTKLLGHNIDLIDAMISAAADDSYSYSDEEVADIDRLSREVPQLCKLAPNTHQYHVEDCYRAGGIMAIFGELDRAGVLDTRVPTVYGDTLAEALGEWDIMPNPPPEIIEFYKAGPGGITTQTAFSQSARAKSLQHSRLMRYWPPPPTRAQYGIYPGSTEPCDSLTIHY